jgi:ABC-type antimicrobial peptide transport system permease subunit
VEPVLPTILEFSIFLNNIIVILIITAVAAVYPSISILRMKVIKALRR